MIQFSNASLTAHLDSGASTVPRRTVLRGDIVTMNPRGEVIRNGRLCIEGANIIEVLDKNDLLPGAFSGAPHIDTQGTLFPGLIDLHNHLTYNAIPLWPVPKRYENRNQWRTDKTHYLAHVKLPHKLLAENADADYRRAIVRFAECRNVIGGTTTGQGISLKSSLGYPRYFEGLMRNVERPLEADWPAAGGAGLDYTLDEIKTQLIPALAKGQPFFYHLSEGTDSAALQRFLDLQAHAHEGSITSNLICIHCVALGPDHFPALRASAGVVWSPTSNLLLYGQTAKIGLARQLGIPIALGVDWGPSGRKNLLGELKTAQAVCRVQNLPFTAQDLVAMVTSTPARMLGWDAWIGSLAPRRRADVLVLGGHHVDPWQALIDAQENALTAVLIDGRIRLGRANGFTQGGPTSSEQITIGGKPYHLDLSEVQIDRLGGMTLTAAVEKLKQGLAQLPQLQAAPGAQLMADTSPEVEDVWQLDDDEDHDEELGISMALAANLVQPMQLESLTEVDDAEFMTRLKSNVNLSSDMRAAL